MKKKRLLTLLALALPLLLLFSIFNSPGISVGGGEAVFQIVSSDVVPSIRIPLIVRVLYSVDGSAPIPAAGVFVRTPTQSKFTDFDGEATLYVRPGNQSILVFWARSKLRPWSKFILVDKPLNLTVLFQEVKANITAIDVESFVASRFSRVLVVFNPPPGEAVYASDPVLFYIDTDGLSNSYPSGRDWPPYYRALVISEETLDTPLQEIEIRIPTAIAVIDRELSFVPVQVVNSTVKEVS